MTSWGKKVLVLYEKEFKTVNTMTTSYIKKSVY